MPFDLDSMTWSCHICEDERPDRFISVRKNKLLMETGIEIQENLRYCNDRASCINAVKTAHLISNFKTCEEIIDLE